MPAPQRIPRSDSDTALLELLGALKARGYHFVTPTPATHARVIARADRRRARDLVDVLGWSLPFEPAIVEPEILDLLGEADMLSRVGALLRADCRVSSVHGHLLIHSAYPTEAADAVFLGPDSYRFADFIAAYLSECSGARIVDIGTGAGVGAIVAAGMCPRVQLTLTDVNPSALRLAAINAAHAGVAVDLVECSGLSGVTGGFDVALANPPYIIDAKGRAYRDGGSMHGARLSLDLAREAAERLNPGGRLLLYTGSAIVGGEDKLKAALIREMAAADCTLAYRELDPDVFGEELALPDYADVDRIAVVGAVATRRG